MSFSFLGSHPPSGDRPRGGTDGGSRGVGGSGETDGGRLEKSARLGGTPTACDTASAAGCSDITGLGLNEKPNIDRREFDRLKAILTNCARHGPASQNRGNHPEFAAHLEGKLAWVRFIHPGKEAKLRAIFERIDWGEGSSGPRATDLQNYGQSVMIYASR